MTGMLGDEWTEPLRTPTDPTSVIGLTPVVGGLGDKGSDAGPSIGAQRSKSASKSQSAFSGSEIVRVGGECTTLSGCGVQWECSGGALASSGSAFP